MASCEAFTISSLSSDTLGKVFSYLETQERSSVLPFVCKQFRDCLRASGDLYGALDIQLTARCHRPSSLTDSLKEVQLDFLEQWATGRAPFARMLQLQVDERCREIYKKPLDSVLEQLARWNKLAQLRISMPDRLWLPEGLTKLLGLKHLHMCARDTIAGLPADIGHLTQLETLRMHVLYYGGGRPRTDFLPVDLLYLLRLRVLEISGHGSLHVPMHIWELFSLEQLIIRDAARVDFAERPHVPAGNATPAQNLTSLMIQGCYLHSVPIQVAMLVNLKELDLSRNCLTNFPATYCIGMPRLERLILSHNEFRMLLRVLPRLRCLRYLDLSHNPKLEVSHSEMNYCPVTADDAHNGVDGHGRAYGHNINSLVYALPRLEELRLKQAPEHRWGTACKMQLGYLQRNIRDRRRSLKLVL